MANRIVWIDWAKSICMFLVILGHCHIRMEEQMATQFIYSFHMMFFFFLSGMLCFNDLSFKTFKKDFRYLIFPYFTYGFILMLFRLLCMRSFDIQIIWPQVKNLFLGLNLEVGPIWFLPAIFISKQLLLILKKVKALNKYLYFFFVIFSFFLVYLLNRYSINAFFFADSALAGLPFYILGYECFTLFERLNRCKCMKLFGMSIMLGSIFVFVCIKNGYANLGSCTIGNSLLSYYIVALSAISSISMLCMIISKFNFSFVTVISHGTIVILGLHGIPLTLLNYYIPLLLGYEPSVYPIYIALLYSTITYCACYCLIIVLARKCPSPFGLRPINFQ